KCIIYSINDYIRGDNMEDKIDKKLHPSVMNFKEFINKHPELRKELRKTGRSWQEYYEKWVLLGEDDAYWDQFKSNKENKTNHSEAENKEEDKSDQKNFEIINQLLKLGENLDFNKIQGQVANLSKTISVVQEL